MLHNIQLLEDISYLNEKSFIIVHVQNSQDDIVSSLIFGKNTDILEEKSKVIVEYTKKVDPLAKIPEVKIRENHLDNPSSFKFIIMAKKEFKEISANQLSLYGYNFYIEFVNLLPRPVSALYGSIREPLQINSYCFSAALVAGGLFPAFVNPEEISKVFPKGRCEVAIDKLSSGDMVQLGSPPGNYTAFFISWHDFVFLDHDISISMNGANGPFLLQSTTNVLELYHYPTDCLLKANANIAHDAAIRILRKNPEWQYPEKITPALLELYDIFKAKKQNKSEAAPRLYEIFHILNEFAHEHSIKRRLFFGLVKDIPEVLKERNINFERNPHDIYPILENKKIQNVSHNSVSFFAQSEKCTVVNVIPTHKSK